MIKGPMGSGAPPGRRSLSRLQPAFLVRDSAIDRKVHVAANFSANERQHHGPVRCIPQIAAIPSTLISCPLIAPCVRS